MNKVFRRILKILGWTVGSIVLLLLLVVVLIQLPGVQNFLKNKAVAFLEKKIGTKVAIRRLSIEFPKTVVLEGVYFEDQKHDTLLAGDKLKVDIAMWKLLKSRVEINDVELDGIRANIYRKGSDTAFNYQYIVDAFVKPTDPNKPKDTSGGGMKIDVKHVALKKILATFRDDQTGSDVYAYLGDFETDIKRFDLDSMRFAIGTVKLHQAIARMYQHKPLVAPKSTQEIVANNTGPINVGLSLGKLDLADIDFDFKNDVTVFAARAQLGALLAEPKDINLTTLNVALNNLVINNTTATIYMGATQQSKTVEKQVETSVQAQVANPWKISLASTTFNNLALKFDNDNSPRLRNQMDYAHLDVAGMNLAATDMAFTPTAYGGNLSKLSLSERNTSFNLHQLQAAFLYNDTGVFLNNLYLETDRTKLRDKIAITWPSLADLPKNPGALGIGAHLTECVIAFSDVLLFAPALAVAPPFAHNERLSMNLTAEITGKLNDLNIPNIEASGLRGTYLAASGRITGLPDPVETVYNLNIRNVRTIQPDLVTFLPPNTIPNTIRIPESMAMHGFFVGSANRFNTHLNIATSRGTAEVAGVMAGVTNPTHASYNLTAGAGNLDLGWILKQEKTIGKVSAQLSAKGSGFDPQTMVADIKGRVISATAQGYTYRNLDLTAHLDHGAAKANATMRDQNLAFDLDADALFRNKFPSIRADINLDSVNLQALGFYKDDFRAHGIIHADLASTDPDALDGTVRISNVLIASAGKRFATDTIAIDAGPSENGRRIAVNSEALVATLDGQYKLTELGGAVQEVLNKYYALPGYKPQAITAPQLWTLDAKVIPSKLLYAFVPAMQGSDTIYANAGFNSAAQDLSLNANARRIQFGTNAVDSLTVRANTAAALDYSVTLNSAGNQQFKLYRTALSGNVANNQVVANLDTKDPGGTSKYQLGATVNALPNDGFKASLAPGLMLNYEQWNVGANNFVQYDPSGIVVNNLTLSNGTQSLSVNSMQQSPTAPIDVRFNNFMISTITRIAEQDSLLVDGIINGQAQVINPTANAAFTSDLTVQNLSYMRDTIGNVAVKVDNETANTLNADVRINGNGNDLSLTGHYLIAQQGLDMNLNITNINLAAVKPFTAGQLDDAGGALKGSIAISGTVPQPKVSGGIRFENAFVVPTLLGERFTLTNSEIGINATGIHLNDFTLADSANNKATIDGDVLTTDFKDYRFAIDVNADNFRAVNSSKGGTKKPFYGKLNLTTALKIRGDMNTPSINGRLKIENGTDFNYILPSSDPEVQSRDGVVKFVDMDAPGDTAILANAGQSRDSLRKVAASGIDLNTQIETDSGAKFALVIDERNGDAVHLRGSADLEAGMDRSGKVSLTGTYVMQEGSYLLTLNFLKRQFSIQPGSSITWTGDPTSATVDITAVYLANTASLDLVEHQLAGRSQSEINKYKQKLPFNVLLKMQGDLLQPVISFDIVLPDRYASQWQEVAGKLDQVRSDESELNKQVFAVLLLGHFVDENPLESAAGGGGIAETYIRQSASRILTDQLNRLAGSLIKGVDLNFGVNSGADYSTGSLQERSDLTVTASKRLLNDRLRVNVGSSFQIEGQHSNNAQSSNIAGDVSLEYQLTKDGRYQARAYRQNVYEALAEGQVVETGAAFVFTLDYDNLREFFRKSGKQKKKIATFAAFYPDRTCIHESLLSRLFAASPAGLAGL